MSTDRHARQRRRLLDQITEDMALTSETTGRTALSERVAEALAEVPRHAFISPAEQSYAYENSALPIGCGQTISQPFIVALMTELLNTAPEHTVLEVGTGSGYQAAVLSRLVKSVYSVEVIPDLAATAQDNLQRLGYRNVTVKTGDGAEGWPEHAPYDGIIVTAASTGIPPALLQQLKRGGRMVIPVGEKMHYQALVLVTKTETGEIDERPVLSVAFVPLVSGVAARAE